MDLATGIVHVRRGWDLVEQREIAPKSRQGFRRVPIAAVLRDHLDQRLLLRGEDPATPVFRTPEWIRRTGYRVRDRWQAHGLPVLTLHEARHVYASFAVAAGVNAKALSTYLGHANIGGTLDLHGHLMPGNEGEAAGLLDGYLARATGSTVAQTVAHPEKAPV